MTMAKPLPMKEWSDEAYIEGIRRAEGEGTIEYFPKHLSETLGNPNDAWQLHKGGTLNENNGREIGPLGLAVIEAIDGLQDTTRKQSALILGTGAGREAVELGQKLPHMDITGLAEAPINPYIVPLRPYTDALKRWYEILARQDSEFLSSITQREWDVYHPYGWDRLQETPQHPKLETLPLSMLHKADRFYASEGPSFLGATDKPFIRQLVGHFPDAVSLPEATYGFIYEQKGPLYHYYSYDNKDFDLQQPFSRLKQSLETQGVIVMEDTGGKREDRQNVPADPRPSSLAKVTFETTDVRSYSGLRHSSVFAKSKTVLREIVEKLLLKPEWEKALLPAQSDI